MLDLETIRLRFWAGRGLGLLCGTGILHESITLLADRQTDFETSALSRLADDNDLTPVTRDYAVRGRQAQSAPELSLGGEKWLEDP